MSVIRAHDYALQQIELLIVIKFSSWGTKFIRHNIRDTFMLLRPQNFCYANILDCIFWYKIRNTVTMELSQCQN